MKSMHRRSVLSLFGASAAAWPLAARAQQPAMPVIGYLGGGEEQSIAIPAALRKGLAEMGFVEGRNVAIDARSTTQADRLRALAAELVQRRVAVLCATVA